MSLIELACRSKECAPPPVGEGGSLSGKGKRSAKRSGGKRAKSLKQVMAGIDALIDRDGAVQLTTDSPFLQIVLEQYAHEVGLRDTPPSPEVGYGMLLDMVETRLAVSEALKSSEPEPAFVEVLRYAHQQVAKEMGSEPRKVWRVVWEGATDPFTPGAGPFGDDLRPDSRKAGTGVTSWWDWNAEADEEWPYRGSMRVGAEEEGRAVVEVEVTAKQVLGRIGDMRDAGEVLVAKTPEVVERLMAGEFPIVTEEMRVVAASALIELACRSRECAPPPVGTGGSSPSRTVFHLTDKSKFKPNPKFVPEDNALAIEQREAPGLYVAKKAWDVERWVNGSGYLRPFVVELEVPEDAITDERWANEGFIPGDRLGEATVKRVIPIDAFARETYGGPGWVEDTLGTQFDSDDPTPEDRGQRPFRDYKYDGPDVREMSPERVKQLKADATKARRKRNSGSFGIESPVIELACRSAECAPPPVGRGGSLPTDAGGSMKLGLPEMKVASKRFIPDTIAQSPENMNYKGTFKVPSSATVKKRIGKTVNEQVEHFAQYGIDLTITDSATSSAFTEERHGALYALDEMAKRYPDALRGMIVTIDQTPGFSYDIALFRWMTPEREPIRAMDVDLSATWLLGSQATPNEKRRLFAATVIHETGHAVTFDALGRDVEAMNALAFESGPVKIGKTNVKRGTMMESVSAYGASNIAEDIAESFTAHILGIDPPDEVGRKHVAQHIEAIAASGAARPDAIAYLYAMAGDDDDDAAVVSGVVELACRSAECAPPPVGRGGSLPKTAPVIHWRVQEVVDDLKDVTSTDPRDEVFQFARQMMESREEMFARSERDTADVDDRPIDSTMESLKAEFDALSAVVPIADGMVRRGTDDAAKLEATARETLPGLRSFVIVGDVNERIVTEAIDVIAQYPEEVRAEIKSLVLGRYPEEVIGLLPDTRRTPGTVAAWGGHPTESGPYQTLWLTPRFVGASDAEIAEGIGTFGKPADRSSENVTIRMAEPERRHKIAIAHEMGHVLHSKAIIREATRNRTERLLVPGDRTQREIEVTWSQASGGSPYWNRMGGITNAMQRDPVARRVTQPGGRSRPIMTTKYGEQNTAETVAESFALAALDGFDNITEEQQAVVRQTLDRALGNDEMARQVSRLEFAEESEDDDLLYGKGERFVPIIDTFQPPNE